MISRSCFLSIIYFIFSSIIVSQNKQFDELIKNDLDRGIQSLDKEEVYNFDINKIVKNTSTTEGSPFNTNDNSQIDSVIIIKISSYEDEIIKYFYTYDSSGNVATETKENYLEISNSYDSNGNLINYISKRWENGQWINAHHATIFYDSLGNKTFVLVLQGKDSSWVNNAQATYFYNSCGDLIIYLEESWNGSKWVNSFRRTNTYDSNYVLISSLFQNWSGSDWTGHSWRRSYTYDLNGNMVLDLSEHLNNNKWENTAQFIYTYDKKDNKLTYLYKTWSEGEWVSVFRYFFTYDNNKNRILTKEENWEENKWVNALKITQTYNANGELDSAKTEMWWDSSWVPGNGTVWMYDNDGNSRHYFGSKFKIYYASLTDVKNEELHIKDYSLSQNYPNPFNPSTIITYSISPNVQSGLSNVSLKIYDVLGREIVTLVNKEQSAGNYEVQFNGSSLTSGIYFYKLQSGNFAESKKMLLIK